jgi:transposase
MTIEITRLDCSAKDLRRKACSTADCAQSRRLLALASVLDGACRSEAAKSAGMERQTLRDWVHRYNAEGVEGLKDRPRTGRKPRLGKTGLTELDEIVETQPDPVKDGVVRWRRRDLKEVIAKRFGVSLSERSVGRILRGRGFRKLSVRPLHPKTDAGAQEAFKQTFPGIL